MAEIVAEEVTEGLDEFGRWIDAMLDRDAAEQGRFFRDGPFNVRAVDGEGRFVGGLSVFDFQGWLYVRLLAVAPEARGHGGGGVLMRAAEEAARKRGHVGVYVDTFDFQAPSFYVKLGYKEIGRLPSIGGQPVRIWFAKAF